MNKNKKNKSSLKIKIYIVITIILILMAFFLSAYINLMLTKQEVIFYNFLPHVIIKSMADNQLHFMLFISVLLTLTMCVILVVNMGNNDYFKSDLDEITETIKTPRKIGQAQHGSARWLKENEYDITFCSFTIEPSKNERVKSLTEYGIDDRKEVENFVIEGIQKGES